MSERQQQIAIMDWWKLQYKKYDGCLFSVPNGSYLNGDQKQRKRQMAGLKAEGLKPGVSDLFLMVAKGGYHGLFLELKDVGKTKSSVSDLQLEHLHLAKEQGYAACWAAGSEEAIGLIDRYMKLD